MTYTFKLARRLAVSRTLGLALFAACSGGDATAPDSSPAHPWTSGSQDDPRFRQTAPVTVSISPRNVTVETNQLIRFLAEGRNSAGDSVEAPVEWSATGGTILPDGRFSAAETGTFMVMGRLPQGENDRVDTATVKVVRRQVKLASVAIAPDSTTLAPGLSQTFLVVGYLKDGRATPIGVNWSATGGTIDAGGHYIAGDTAGTYQVIARHISLPLADTAVVTISAPPPPPPPPAEPAPPPAEPEPTPAEPEPTPAEPEPTPPEPVLVQVTLMPGSATLAPFATRRFVAFGRTAEGDSIPLTPTSATGGTLSADGVYTAGSTAGTFRVIAAAGSLADTSTVVITAPLGSGPAGSGIPMGLGGLLAAGVDPGSYTMAMDAYTADNIVARLSAARSKKLKVLMSMTGGSHSNYLTNGVFDMAKWKARQNTFNTSIIKAAIADGVAEGLIVGNSVIDEPNNTTTGSNGGDANSWGPEGTITKAMVDEMARYVRAMFPTLPVGYAGRYDWRDGKNGRPLEILKDVDFAIRQYSWRKPDGDPGNILRYRDEALAQGATEGIVTLFSMNLLNGGIRVDPDTWICPLSTTGGRGQTPGTCRMHADQVEDWGKILGAAGCGLMMWRYDQDFFYNPENQAALRVLKDFLAPLPRKLCI